MHELVWVHGGTLTARVGGPGAHSVGRVRLLIPAGAVHAGRLTADVVFHDAFLAPEHTPVEFDGP